MSDYKPDRWRDRTIIAQVAAKEAGEMVRELHGESYDAATEAWVIPEQKEQIDKFNTWAEVIYTKILDLVGNPDENRESADTVIPFKPRSGSSAGSRPYADTTINFGKYKGMTIDDVANTTDEDGSTGYSYLEWLAANTNNAFIKKAVVAYLGA